MLTGLKIEVKALVYNGTQQQIETVEITEMDILELAEKRIAETYSSTGQPSKIYPTIQEVSEEN